ncbi:MAG: hypothetical protein C0506_01275 [Anaerolinea sp.]|nr:hypothetical protein [Anaerolinea sp.]
MRQPPDSRQDPLRRGRGSDPLTGPRANAAGETPTPLSPVLAAHGVRGGAPVPYDDPPMDLLAGLHVSVASYGVAAAYTGWLLRQFGADVDHLSALDPEGVGAFLAEGARFDPTPGFPAGAGAILITDAPVTAANREMLAALARDRRVVWITPWGLAGEASERPASSLVLHAAGGWLAAVGEPDREPLGPPGSQGEFTAGLYAAIAALAPGMPATGLTDVPVVEAIVATLIYDPVAFQYLGALRGRAGRRFARTQPTLVTLPVKDGHVGLHAALHGQWLTLCQVMGQPELASDPRFASLAERIANVASLDDCLMRWLAPKGRWQAYHELQASRIPISAHPDMEEVLASPQLGARRSWREVVTPSGRRYQVPGPPARVNAVADHGERVRDGETPWRAGRLRVVDLSMGWAGPLVGMMLASFGADVIKVESHAHFDWWRGSRPPGDDPGLRLFERSHVFNSANRGKRGITLNLATPGGTELARRLISTADVVVENFGAGVLEKLGLTFEALSPGNPGLVMVRQPGFGSTGPEANYLAFGNTIEGMSGLSSLMGYAGGPPMMMSNAFGDPISGLNGTVAVLAALAAREHDGRGRLVECAQLEGFLPLVSEGLIEYQQTGVVPPRRGNQRAGHVLSGVFRCAGEDEWVAIDAEDMEDWTALASHCGLRGEDPMAAVGAWTASRSREEVVYICLTAGVPAAAVATEAEVLFNEPMASSGFWQLEEREVVGTHLYPGLPISTAGERPAPTGPAPTLGQHNVEVLSAMGLDATAIDELRAANVIGEVPA